MNEGLARHLAAENAHDVEGIVRTFAEDGVLVLNGVTFRGREAIRKVHERFGFGNSGAFSDLRVREIHRHTAPDAIVLEERLSGRHTGPWEGVAPAGREFEIAVCAVYELGAAGELTAERVYFDGSALLKQLRPTPDAPEALPDLATVLAQVLQRVPVERQPLLIATAERLAADRYRIWADQPENGRHRSRLLACAGREEDIATSIEALHAGAVDIQAVLLRQHPDLVKINRDLFAGRPLRDQLALQARGERLGAATWRAFARHEPDPSRVAVFNRCAGLEEESALVLESILTDSR